jgi:hypothetical protein
MKTEVIMQRSLYGVEIAQKSKSEFLSATDLVKAGNKHRVMEGKDIFLLKDYFIRKSTKEFMEELESEFGTKCKINAKGRNQHTWVHPFLFIDLALAISPKLKIETYKWLYDYLLRYRNESGDSYKRACGAIWDLTSNKSLVKKNIMAMAKDVKKACGVTDWNRANKQQLIKRDNIHQAIELYSDVIRNPDEVVRLAILKYK